MKAFVLIAALAGLALPNYSLAANFQLKQSRDGRDSIIITFGDKTRMVIYGDSRDELKKIVRYDLNALLKDLQAKLNESDADTTLIREEFDGRDYLINKDGEEEDYIKIGLKGVRIKDGETTVRIDSEGVEVEDEEHAKENSAYKRIGKRVSTYRASSPRKGFNVALGLNTYGLNTSGPGYNINDYDLKPFGSRYVSLGYIVSARVIKGKKAGMSFDFGADFSWNNLMFDGDNTIAKDDHAVFFPNLTNSGGTAAHLKKSKLVVPYVNLSLMPTVSFRNSFISYVSAGVYGGYRLGSYAKVVEEGSKDVNRDHKNFYLNDFRYGISAELGIRHFPDLFVTYDMNELYQNNKGPNVRMLNFGIRLF